MGEPPQFNPVGDVISGLIMAATSVPQLVAYAETVGVSPHRGLSTAGPSLIAWGLTTGSPYMNSGVTSVTALMARTDLDGEAYAAEYGEERYVYLVSAYSLWVGAASILLALIGFGRLAQGVPRNVRSGFKWGCAVGVLASAVPNGLLSGGSSELKSAVAASSSLYEIQRAVRSAAPAATGFVSVTDLLYALSNPWVWSAAPAALFFACSAIVTRGKRYMPPWTPPGTEVILATAAATLYSVYGDYGGGVVGPIPSVDPDRGLSLGGIINVPVEVLDPSDLAHTATATIIERFGGLVPLLISSALFASVNFLSIVGIASGFESEDGVPWSAPRELIAQGAACLGGGITGSAPVSGSMSRSLVSRMTGATSQLACVVTALLWIYCLPYMGIMSSTPKAALGAVIVSAVVGSVLRPRDLLVLRGGDALVGWGTGLVTAVTSPTVGFGVGLLLASAVRLVTGVKKKEENKEE